MTDIINNTTPIEAAVVIAVFAIGLAYSKGKPPLRQRRYLFVYGLGLILYTTLLRRVPIAWNSSSHTARLEFAGFNPSGFFLNILLFVPLGFSFKKCHWWFWLMLSATIEVVQEITHLGMFDVWDIVANTLGGLIGCAAAKRHRAIRKKP